MGWPAPSKFSLSTDPLHLPPALLRWRPSRIAQRPHCRQLEAILAARLSARKSECSARNEAAKDATQGKHNKVNVMKRLKTNLEEVDVAPSLWSFQSAHLSQVSSSSSSSSSAAYYASDEISEAALCKHPQGSFPQNQQVKVSSSPDCLCCRIQQPEQIKHESEFNCCLCNSLLSSPSYRHSNKPLLISVPGVTGVATTASASTPNPTTGPLSKGKVQPLLLRQKRAATTTAHKPQHSTPSNKLIQQQLEDYYVSQISAKREQHTNLPCIAGNSTSKLKARCQHIKLTNLISNVQLNGTTNTQGKSAKNSLNTRQRGKENTGAIKGNDVDDDDADDDCRDEAVHDGKAEDKKSKSKRTFICCEQGKVNNNNNNNKEEKKTNNQVEKSQEGGKSEKQRVHNHWADINKRYRKMGAPEKGGGILAGHSSRNRKTPSCLSHLLISTCQFLFPILFAFQDYSPRRDISSDIIAGFTVAILHIPQGMAYGLLAGVDPIYGLYVSFVPVFVMSLMSKSRHVSHGTFAVISMLLASAIDSVRSSLTNQQRSGTMSGINQTRSDQQLLAALVMVDNHQAQVELPSQQILKDFLSSNQELAEHREQQASLVTHLPESSTLLSVPYASNIEILTTICLVVGLMQLIMSAFRLGCLTLMFSDQLISSFTTGAAFFVGTSQLEALFDVTLAHSPDGLFEIFRNWWLLGNHLFHDGCNQYTALLSLSSLLFLIALKEFLEPALKRRFRWLICIPSDLLFMCFLIFISWYWELNERYSIRVLGNIPSSLPSPQMPRLDLAPLVIQDSLTIALVSLALNLSLGQMAAKRFRYKLNSNQELFALGTSNVIGSFFSCFPCASSLSRTSVQTNLNAKSPLCSLISCSIVVLIVCYFGPVLCYLPRSTLSCVILINLKGVIRQVNDFKENWRLSKLDALIWAATFLSVISVGVTYGIIIGIAISLAAVLLRLCSPHHAILGQIPGTDIYVDINSFVECIEFERIKIFKINSALCYLNKTSLKSCIEKVALRDGRKNQLSSLFCSNRQQIYSLDYENNKLRIDSLVIDCSGLSYCDYSGISTLIDIIEEFAERQINVYLAACPLKIINMLESLKQTKILHNNVYPSITDTVSHIQYLENRSKLSPFDANKECLIDCQQELSTVNEIAQIK